MNDTTQKIVAETDEQIGRRLHDVGVDCPCDFIDLIQSAIEKATEGLKRERDCSNDDLHALQDEASTVCLKCGDPIKIKLRAAHAGEQWTEETVLEITENLLGVKPTRKARKAIADAHNATLQSTHASEQDLLDLAWGIIANAGGGDWTKESKEWQDAAAKWRDQYKVLPSAHASEQEADRLLGDLLAVIHGDGGHYETEHGSKKATEDALTKYHQLLTRLDAAEYALSQRPAPATASEMKEQTGKP